MPDLPTRLDRRTVLRGGAAAGIALLTPSYGGPAAVAVAMAGPGYLTAAQLVTLRAAIDRFIPGPPEDVDAGAVDAGCAEAIDALLAAFASDPPHIYAGAPFSDRGGHPTNLFAEFLPLDAYEARAWRLRIEGSAGRPELERNGPVVGWQQIYTDGLAALDDATPGPLAFADAPAPTRDLILRGSDDPAVTALVDIAFVHTVQFMYGAPEYGGNRDLLAWAYTGFDGDVQPRGYTREEVERPDQDGAALPPLDLPDPLRLALTSLVAPEAAHHVMARSGGRLSGLRAEADKVLEYYRGQ